jgi:hypothetical protein
MRMRGARTTENTDLHMTEPQCKGRPMAQTRTDSFSGTDRGRCHGSSAQAKVILDFLMN